MPKITENDKRECDELPTMRECETAIKCRKNNKSPGQDGLTAEFYNMFWNELKDIYYASFLKNIEIGILPFSQ